MWFIEMLVTLLCIKIVSDWFDNWVKGNEPETRASCLATREKCIAEMDLSTTTPEQRQKLQGVIGLLDDWLTRHPVQTAR